MRGAVASGYAWENSRGSCFRVKYCGLVHDSCSVLSTCAALVLALAQRLLSGRFALLSVFLCGIQSCSGGEWVV